MNAVCAAPLTGRLPSYITAITAKGCATRFMESNGQGVAEYELLELILFRALPRQDVKPLARRSAGYASGIWHASCPRLRNG
jgi:DNA repair protein RadC